MVHMFSGVAFFCGCNYLNVGSSAGLSYDILDATGC